MTPQEHLKAIKAKCEILILSEQRDHFEDHNYISSLRSTIATVDSILELSPLLKGKGFLALGKLATRIMAAWPEDRL